MRLRYPVTLLLLIVVLNAGVSYGVTRWAGARGPQGAAGPPGPVATADAKTLLCAAAIGDLPQEARPPDKLLTDAVAKYCP